MKAMLADEPKWEGMIEVVPVAERRRCLPRCRRCAGPAAGALALRAPKSVRSSGPENAALESSSPDRGRSRAARLPGGGAGGAARVSIFYYPWYGNPGARRGLGALARAGRLDRRHRLELLPGPRALLELERARSSAPRCARSRRRASRRSSPRGGAGARAEDVRLPLIVKAAHAAGLVGGGPPRAVPGPDGRRPSRRTSTTCGRSGSRDIFVYQPVRHPPTPTGPRSARESRGVQLYAQTTLVGQAADGRDFDGVYTYDVLLWGGDIFSRLCAPGAPRRAPRACRRSGPATTRRARPPTCGQAAPGRRDLRRDVAAAIRSSADGVTITSYNEWHEGTQIEPARARPAARPRPRPPELRGRLRAAAAAPRSARTSTGRVLGGRRSCGRGARVPGGPDGLGEDVGRAAEDERARARRPGRRRASDGCARSTDDVRPPLEAERGRPLGRAEREQRLDRDHVPAAGRAAGDPLQLAQLLERIDADVRVGADADRRCRARRAPRPGRSRRRGSPRSSGRRQTRAPASASRSSSCVVGVRGVDDGGRRAEAARAVRAARSGGPRARRGTPRSRAAARRRARGAAAPRRPRSAPISSSHSAGQARTEWGATPTRTPARAASRPGRGTRRRSPGGSGGCLRGAYAARRSTSSIPASAAASTAASASGEAEVVELPDRRVPGGRISR